MFKKGDSLKLYMTKEKNFSLEEELGKLDEKTFMNLVNELQYSTTYHMFGRKNIQRKIYSTKTEGSRKIETTHKDRRKEIIRSELYASIRTELGNRTGKSIPTEWTGWIGYRNLIEIEKITDAIGTIVENKYFEPKGFCVNLQRRADKVKGAKETLKGFEGIFLKGDITETFKEKYVK